jgi:hypothetical protein
MPFQVVNDSSTEATVGTQTRKMWMKAGTPTMIARMILSRPVSRL